MEVPNNTMGMTTDVNDAGNADRQDTQDAYGSWNQQSHLALSSQPHHKEGAKPSSSRKSQQMSSSNTIAGLTEGRTVRTLLATGGVSTLSSSGDIFLRTAPIMNESFFKMPSQIQDGYQKSIPTGSGLDGRDVTVPNVALQDEYAVEHNRIMFPNHFRVQSGQSSSCSGGSCSVDGNESPEEGVISKQRHQSMTAFLTDRVQIPDELDMTLPFPVKLHYIVSNPRFKEYIDWCPHGRAWRVLNQQAFERDVIPMFFRSAKFTSFMRQVNGWAFVRIPQGPDVNCYYHEMFLRGIPRLAFHMKRPPKVKNAASIARKQTGAGVGGSPEFYRISQIAPLPPVMPYKITIKLAKDRGHDGMTDVMSAHFATRYVIEPIPVDALEENVDHQMLLEETREGNLAPRPLVDTFNGGGSNKKFEPVDHAASSGNEESSMEGQGRVASSSSTRGSSMSTSALDLATVGMQGLSAADISYLVHQNRTLRKHF